MKILALPRFGMVEAGSRRRMLQFLPELAEAGHLVRVRPFFHAASERPCAPAMTWYRAGLRRWHCRERHDLVWLEDEAYPALPALAARLLARGTGPRVIYDLTHATTATPENASPERFPGALGFILDEGMAGPPAPAPVLERPRLVDWRDYETRAASLRGSTAGWFGSLRSEAELRALAPLLAELAASRQLGLALPDGVWRPSGIPSTRQPQTGQATDFSDLALALFPRPEPQETGQALEALVRCLAAGVPVVAADTDLFRRAILAASAGFLAEDEEAWRFAIGKLLAAPELRLRLGENGRTWVRGERTRQAWAPRLIAFLERCRPAVC